MSTTTERIVTPWGIETLAALSRFCRGLRGYVDDPTNDAHVARRHYIEARHDGVDATVSAVFIDPDGDASVTFSCAAPAWQQHRDEIIAAFRAQLDEAMLVVTA